MSSPTGIKTYTSAPVNPNQQEEGTHTTTSQPEPATAEPETTPSQPQPAPATTTATAAAPSTPPINPTSDPTTSAPPQPGATAVQPTPTAATSTDKPPPTTSFPEPATSTTKTPPAPQPGAQPSPAAETTTRSPHPEPPKAGEAISPPPQAAQPQSYPQSYSYNAPTLGPQTALPNSTSSPYSSVYQANAGSHARSQQTLPSHYGPGAGAGSGGGASSIFPPEEEEGFLGAAKGWMRWSGNKLAEVEKGFGRRLMMFMIRRVRYVSFGG
ncbi:hypothetical protein N7491_006933 [Penicillium cf. griseofulvum]|nr:hypothetical protein N7491_006933 [Penicillium cf. griseofulvum]